MKRIISVLLIILLALTGSATASEIDLDSMSFDQLLELRGQIDDRLRTMYPLYDYILEEGNYFVGIDLPEGKVLLSRLTIENKGIELMEIHDENQEILYGAGMTATYSRVRCTLEEGQELILWGHTPIGVQYIQE